MKLDVTPGAIVAFVLFGSFRMMREVASCLSAAYRMQALRSGGRGLRDDMVRGTAPVGGHLAASAGGVGGRAYGLEE